MKNKLFIALISVVLSLHLLNAQTSYMPVFSDTTRYYSAIEGVDGGLFGYGDYIRVNDSTVMHNRNNSGEAYFFGKYDMCVENTTHSKLWGIDTSATDSPAKRNLLMDLDLNLGDTYTDSDGNTLIVDSVYTKDGRKHIRFGKKWDCDIYLYYYAGDGYEGTLGFYGKLQLEFIEGVGNNFSFFTTLGTGPVLIPWVCAQYKDGKLSYQPDGFMPLPAVLADNTNINIISQSIRLSPIPTSDNLTIELPEKISLNNLRYQIVDINGRLLQNGIVQNRVFFIDMSKNPSGTYLMQFSAGSTLLATKVFIKS
jgi:hypothetical protein